jgi:hypothetical protein
MFRVTTEIVRSALCCAALLTLVGCTLLTPDWTPRRASASGCAEKSMHACVIDNYGKRCGCTSKESVEAILRSQ